MLLAIQKEIKKEIERRKVGKDMQDFKRRQEDEKTKRLLEERNREKAEEKAARERVKQQIALVSLSFSLIFSQESHIKVTFFFPFSRTLVLSN